MIISLDPEHCCRALASVQALASGRCLPSSYITVTLVRSYHIRESKMVRLNCRLCAVGTKSKERLSHTRQLLIEYPHPFTLTPPQRSCGWAVSYPASGTPPMRTFLLLPSDEIGAKSWPDKDTGHFPVGDIDFLPQFVEFASILPGRR